MTEIHVISFGYGHADAPEANLVVDVRKHFRDPHIDPALRQLTAADSVVRAKVLDTPGIRGLIAALVAACRAYSQAPGGLRVTVAVGCVGGRHRSATIAAEVATCLAYEGATVALHHRDIARPVVQRTGGPA